MQFKKKMYTIPEDMIEAVAEYAKANPEYAYNRRPNESAVVREAITFFLQEKAAAEETEPAA